MVQHDGRMCDISYDSIVYDTTTGDAIGVWNDETGEVVEANLIVVDGRTCFVADDCAVYDLETEELVGDFQCDEFESIHQSSTDSGTLGHVAFAAPASTRTDESGYQLRRSRPKAEQPATATPPANALMPKVQQRDEAAAAEEQPVPPATSSRAGAGAAGPPSGEANSLSEVEKALDLIKRCAACESKGQNQGAEHVWDDVAKLGHVLVLAEQPEFELPTRFQKAVDICSSCSGEMGQLQCVGRMADEFEAAELSQVLQYFNWLETALQRPVSTSAIVPHREQMALRSWPRECALLQGSAQDMRDALLRHAPEYLQHMSKRDELEMQLKALQRHQSSAGMRMAKELKAVTASFSNELRDKRGLEWAALAQLTQTALTNIKQLTGGFVVEHETSLAASLSDCEALSKRAEVYDSSAAACKKQIRKHEQAFKQAVDRFAEFRDQIVAWSKESMVPKLSLLKEHSNALQTITELKSRLASLESEKILAEDALDEVDMKLRKHRRRMAGSWAQRSTTKDQEVDTYLESELEREKQRLEENIGQLDASLQQAEKDLSAASSTASSSDRPQEVHS